jgi:uncharacterized protein involved in outer membrane biogenesis
MSMNLKKLVLIAGIFGGLALAALIFLLTWTWESPSQTQTVLAALSSESFQVEASRVRLQILRGITLSDVHIKTRLEDGNLEAKASEVILAHQPLRLLSGVVSVRELRLVEPAIEILWDKPKKTSASAKKAQAVGAAAVLGSSAGAAAVAPSAEDEAWAVAIDVEQITFENGRLVMREDGIPEEMVRFEGLSVILADLKVPAGAADLIQALEAQGTIKADQMINPALTASGVEGQITISDGHLVIRELQLPSDLGILIFIRFQAKARPSRRRHCSAPRVVSATASYVSPSKVTARRRVGRAVRVRWRSRPALWAPCRCFPASKVCSAIPD